MTRNIQLVIFDIKIFCEKWINKESYIFSASLK